MAHKEINCWEFKKCERQPGGKKVEDLGVCPAAVDASFNGINNGKNAGRICWAVAGTCCGGKVQGTFAEKRRSCVTCDFYQHVQKQEETSNATQKLLKFFSEDRTGKLLLDLTQCRFVRAGERIVTQGEIRNKAYIIQRGSCLVVVEKDGQSHPVDHRGKGDIIGVTSILTGEPQIAHVEAETDVELWTLEGAILNNISSEYPELFDFLTEIVASRFDTTRPIAERKISKYIASDIIGRGAFSVVYGGIHAGLKMPVTIKIKILDFGLACPFGSENFLTGTPLYMSPEQVQCFPVDQRSDIYSLGLVVYEMATGKRPFEGKDQWQVMEMRANSEIPDPAAAMPDLPEALRYFILKACARDPSLRYQNIPEALESLKALITEYGLTNGEVLRGKRKVRIFLNGLQQ